MFDRLVFSSEHASNRIPARYAARFRRAGRQLASHRGYDAGAGPIARGLARALGAPLYEGRVSRLLVDLNRSVGHRGLFSEYMGDLSRKDRRALLARYYHPYRNAVEAAIRQGPGRVLHLSIHSFTPILDGKVRNADVGLLYDPGRPLEVAAAVRLLASLHGIDPGLRLRRNYPYRGTADGLTTHLRRLFGPDRYAGIEIEVNQGTARSAAERNHIVRALEGAIGAVLSGRER